MLPLTETIRIPLGVLKYETLDESIVLDLKLEFIGEKLTLKVFPLEGIR